MKQLITLFSFLVWMSCSLVAQIDRDFSAVDTRSKSNPPGKAIDMATLTKYLTDEYDNDIDKVRAIGVWIAHNIPMHVEAALEQREEEVLPTEIITRRLAGPEHHAHLFLAMCQEANIKCYKVRGYVKNRFYDEGDPFYISNHVWNVVELDSTWYMVDMAWASGSLMSVKTVASPEEVREHNPDSHQLEWQQEFREQYFLKHPKEWRMTHMPIDPMWQMVAHPMSLEIFEKGDDAVTAFIEENPSNTTLHYDRHLKKYDESHSFYKSVYVAKNALEFNPRNHKAIAYSSATYALHLTDGRTRNIQVCKQAKEHYQNALENAQLFKEDITKIYHHEKTKLATRKSAIFNSNRTYMTRNSKFIEGFTRTSSKIGDRIARLSERAKGWEIKSKEATSDNLKDVTKPKRQREEADSLLAINQAKLEKYKPAIVEAMTASKMLRDSAQYYYDKIKKNWNLQHGFYPPVRQNIDIKIQINISQATLKQLEPYAYKVDSLKKNCIRGIDEHNDAILDTIEVLFDEKATKDSAAIAMIRDSKKMVRQNKRMVTADMGEDAQYAQLNEQLKEAYTLKTQPYYDKINYQKSLLNKLQKDKKLAVMENRLLQQERDIEEKLFEKRVAFAQSLVEIRKEKLLEMTTKCKTRMKIVDKILREAGEEY